MSVNGNSGDKESKPSNSNQKQKPAEKEVNISWNSALETLIAEEAERCSGLSWLHNECEAYFAKRTNMIALPVIILSTANGFLSGSSQMIFGDASISSIGLGVVSLFTGLLSTIGSYFAWAKRTEAHKISAIQYQKISRFLTIELSLPKKERIQARDILKITRDQIERLMEISPPIPESILRRYKQRFKDRQDVTHPEIISGLHKVFINKMEESEKQIQPYVKPEFKLPSFPLSQPKSSVSSKLSVGSKASTENVVINVNSPKEK
uniref:Uncharacterized protein n=1 Tax=viral metagenome TaxID=1070528 RepID=A0A6C0HF44_9ZZZZ